MGGTLNVDTSNLTAVGNSIIEVAAAVRAIYTNMTNTINAVTSNESWKGAASETFLQKFDAIRPEFERDLASLEELGPTINEVSGNYQTTEEDNVAGINNPVGN